MAPLHVILATLGTDGDVLPYVGLAAALRRRGHHTTVAAAENYRDLVHGNGSAFVPLVSRAENVRCFGHPDFWHPLAGPLVAARWGPALVPRQYEILAGLAGPAAHAGVTAGAGRGGAIGGLRTVLVASPGVVAARVVQEKLGVPLASVVLQPWMLVSSTAPPVMPGGLTLPRRAPRPVGRLYWRGVDFLVGLMMGPHLAQLRRKLGLPPVRRPFQWWLSPDRVLGMFPPWFGEPQPDWPTQLRLTGFPFPVADDATPHALPALPADLAAFCDAGPPPVTFTFGTGMRQPGRAFRAALAACRALGVRGVFLTRYADSLPAALPPTIRHVPHAPFGALFPRCAAVVHHGGVGTLARALAAGAPQLVVPHAFDQTDNAVRLERLGVGRWLQAGRADTAGVAGSLRQLLTPAIRARSREVAGWFTRPGMVGADEGLEQAAGWVERLAADAGGLP